MSHSSQAIQRLPLPYFEDSGRYFCAVRDQGWGIWLDSGRPRQTRGRFDIISAGPKKQLISRDGLTQCHQASGQFSQYSDPWQAIKQELAQQPLAFDSDLPFIGGAMGYLAYDLGRQQEHLCDQTEEDCGLPDLLMGIYEWAVIQDHQQQQSWLVAVPGVCETFLQTLQQNLIQPPRKQEKHFNFNSLKPNLSRNDYLQKIGSIKEYIVSGDCYQVNFAQRFEAAYQGDSLVAYEQLRQALPSQFSSYFETPYGAILSLSPERFLSCRDGQVLTQPIKGTAPRGVNMVEDEHLARELRQSEKNQAENLMIVDLLRNDISKVCVPNSVRVPKLFELESYANVHHLVSSVTGQLDDGENAVDLLAACFPGGSITGAPKIRAMEVIEELENRRRSVYCGSLGYFSFDGQMDTNIAIRTVVANGEKMYVWGGGGIVADSDAESEYQESLTKIGLILETLKQL
ncbi:aminodeoxychorismate synthase component I [Pseudomaricurvus alkylphenolicus]|jgi:para-aminobenzoate synthetase component 1|uniref:aminodeoxychorismate synthase component I n=1 Tax=Pseudomaricurvus alkylphenolicus TaxID=1306991 RepID=UPI001420B36C|nr:aminodeoxychorismate synthase component I [Pseudomaricurvus alkylphenolicus]NIB41198.1 aminodeoxychorismate synthase component I [Pseudomaricurvus alkylphenolicus]